MCLYSYFGDNAISLSWVFVFFDVNHCSWIQISLTFNIFYPFDQGGALGQLVDNPFGAGYGTGALEGCDEDEWVVSKDKT